MYNLITALLFAYSSIYYYESPTYPGISSLYADLIWYEPGLIGVSEYNYSISFTGIIPFSASDVKHANLSFFKKMQDRFCIFAGLKHRALQTLYTENTFLLGVGYSYHKLVFFNTALRLINLKLSGNGSITKPTLDLSFGLRKSFFLADVFFSNVLKPDLSISQSGGKSNTSKRIMLSFNYPKNVYFSGGFTEEAGYSTPFFSTEVWFTHGFNVAFGVENHTVEGAISLRSKKMGVLFRLKSHTVMGATYIAGLSFYKE